MVGSAIIQDYAQECLERLKQPTNLYAQASTTQDTKTKVTLHFLYIRTSFRQDNHNKKIIWVIEKKFATANI